MTRSGFAPTPELKKDLSASIMWNYHGREFPAPTFELGISPAGCMYSTVNDLARFMEALFAGGKGANGPMLKPATLAEMLKVQFATPDAPRGIGLGFIDRPVSRAEEDRPQRGDLRFRDRAGGPARGEARGRRHHLEGLCQRHDQPDRRRGPRPDAGGSRRQAAPRVSRRRRPWHPAWQSTGPAIIRPTAEPSTWSKPPTDSGSSRAGGASGSSCGRWARPDGR